MDEQYLRNKKGSCWKKCTRVEKWLFLLCTLLLVLFLVVLFIKFGRRSEEICLSPSCVKTAAQVLEKVDLSVDPCEDFYKFACGNFLKNTILPDYKSSLSSFNIVGDMVNEQMRSLLAEPIKETDARPFVLAKSTYQACMNTTAIEENSLGNLLRIIKNLGGWPVLEGIKWNDRNFNWKTLNYEFMKIGLKPSMFFDFAVEPDPNNSSARILTLNQVGMFHETQFKKGINNPLVRTYYDYMVKLFEFLGADSHRARRTGEEVIGVMSAISSILVPPEQKRNQSLLQNRRTFRELQQEFPYVPWLEFVNKLTKPITQVKYDDTVIVVDLKYFQRLEKILKKPKSTLANFMFFRMYSGLVPFLSENFIQLRQEFLRVTTGRTQRSPRWEECVRRTNQNLRVAIAALYVKNVFNEESKAKSVEIVNNILSVFTKQLESVSWMDEVTRKEALAKANSIRIRIGYPDELLDKKKIDEYYQNLTVVNPVNNYLEAMLNISLFLRQRMFYELTKPVDKNDWLENMGIPEVNSYYDTADNSIIFPASILQGVFFSNDRPQYLNYGGIGYIIGHEITHGFDDEGRQYDKEGNLVDWWQPKTSNAFAEKAQCIIDQYGNITVPEINININGINSQGENIADNGGAKHAYLAYKKWAEENNPEAQLPGLPYTPEQMFWISAGNIWCEVQRNEQLKANILNQLHAPHYYRVNIPLMNSEYFAKDFNCPLGSKMNPEQKCTVW